MGNKERGATPQVVETIADLYEATGASFYHDVRRWALIGQALEARLRLGPVAVTALDVFLAKRYKCVKFAPQEWTHMIGTTSKDYGTLQAALEAYD